MYKNCILKNNEIIGKKKKMKHNKKKIFLKVHLQTKKNYSFIFITFIFLNLIFEIILNLL